MKWNEMNVTQNDNNWFFVWMNCYSRQKRSSEKSAQSIPKKKRKKEKKKKTKQG